MAQKATLQAIRTRLDNRLGKRVKVRAAQGRRRVFEKEGVLEKTYPSLFLIRFDEDDNVRMSWTYIDVLTDNVELHFKEDIADDN